MEQKKIESKKDLYRNYLHESGLVEQVVKVLVSLYEEPDKPENAIEYLNKYLGSACDVDAEKVKEELDKLTEENGQLKVTVENLQKEIDQLRPPEQQNPEE